jgi:rhodanese-related sulfurtransferase
MLATLAGCAKTASAPPTTRYVTEYGLGPDKWAAAWLLSRHADPGAQLSFTRPGDAPVAGIKFDLPAAELRRIGNRSTFEAVRTRFAIDDPIVTDLTALVNEIEINYWTARTHPEADLIEQAFRELQYLNGRDAVAPQCYLAFFDRVYQVLQDARTKAIPATAERLQLSCGELQHLADKDRELIREVPVIDVLSAAAAGRKVVYVDVREADEFSEGHIPGALNIPIRDVTPELRDRLSGADYVVSYCVKDFRGYEMAKALAQIGVQNSVIMRPYGIKGWVALGLPITGAKEMSESQSAQNMERCLADIGTCLNAASST